MHTPPMRPALFLRLNAKTDAGWQALRSYDQPANTLQDGGTCFVYAVVVLVRNTMLWTVFHTPAGADVQNYVTNMMRSATCAIVPESIDDAYRLAIPLTPIFQLYNKRFIEGVSLTDDQAFNRDPMYDKTWRRDSLAMIGNSPYAAMVAMLESASIGWHRNDIHHFASRSWVPRPGDEDEELKSIPALRTSRLAIGSELPTRNARFDERVHLFEGALNDALGTIKAGQNPTVLLLYTRFTTEQMRPWRARQQRQAVATADGRMRQSIVQEYNRASIVLDDALSEPIINFANSDLLNATLTRERKAMLAQGWAMDGVLVDEMHEEIFVDKSSMQITDVDQDRHVLSLSWSEGDGVWYFCDSGTSKSDYSCLRLDEPANFAYRSRMRESQEIIVRKAKRTLSMTAVARRV